MRLLPHKLALLVLEERAPPPAQGISKEEARRWLVELTGQDFGLDAKKWREWIKEHMTPWGRVKG
jgi:hypothetical protein